MIVLHVQMAYRQNLGGDVVRSPNSRGTVDLAVGIHLEAGPEVRQPDVSVFVNENIVRFNIPAHGKSCDQM